MCLLQGIRKWTIALQLGHSGQSMPMKFLVATELWQSRSQTLLCLHRKNSAEYEVHESPAFFGIKDLVSGRACNGHVSFLKINKVCCWKFLQHCLRNQNTRSSIHDFHTNFEHGIFLSSANSKKLGGRNYYIFFHHLLCKVKAGSDNVTFFMFLPERRHARHEVPTLQRPLMMKLCQTTNQMWPQPVSFTFSTKQIFLFSTDWILC